MKNALTVLVDTKDNYYVIFVDTDEEVTYIKAENIFHAYCVMYHYDNWMKGEDV